MEIKIQAIHFEATEKLEQFIEKKLSKLAKFNDEIGRVEVSLFAQEVCNTFEEAIDKTVESLLRQASKYKEKQKNR